jgi:hypothetical protein
MARSSVVSVRSSKENLSKLEPLQARNRKLSTRKQHWLAASEHHFALSALARFN